MNNTVLKGFDHYLSQLIIGIFVGSVQRILILNLFYVFNLVMTLISPVACERSLDSGLRRSIVSLCHAFVYADGVLNSRAFATLRK